MNENETSLKKILNQFKADAQGRREFRVECQNHPQQILNELIQEGLFLKVDQLFYFETDDGQKEILSLGHSKNPSMDLIFSQIYPFSPLKKDSKWQSLTSQTPLAPKVLITRNESELYLEICEKDTTFIQQMQEFYPVEKDHWSIDQDFLDQEKERYLETFEKAVKKLEANKLEKVVLARRLQLQNKNSSGVDWRGLAQSFLTRPGQSFRYLMKKEEKIFLSLTPELLFTLTEEEIETQAIAGTCPRGDTPEEDQKLFEQLIRDPKEKNEHDIVRREIEAGLKSLQLSPQWQENHAPLKLTHIQHIRSKLKAPWSGQSLEDLITALHPTPAVGGAPRTKALESILAWEGFERGAYAAPIIVNTSEKTYALVGLRSGLWDGESLELYAGSGLVDGSTAEKEWSETQNKLKNFTAELK